MLRKVLLTINAISEDRVLGAASIILVDLMIMCQFLVVVKTRKNGDVTYCLCLNNIVN